MNIEKLKEVLPDFLKDIKLNLSTVLNKDSMPDLAEKQIAAIALASAYAARNADVIKAITQHANEYLSKEEINATKAASAIMAMNNVYYRFTHSVDDQSYASMPAKLRMNVMANPGMDKVLFELCSLAVSAINGCAKCMNAHSMQLDKASVSKETIQASVRIAAVINAAALSVEMGS